MTWLRAGFSRSATNRAACGWRWPHHPAALPVPAPGSTRAALAVLADYERQVLADVRARLADTGGAPFEAVAAACAVDVRGTWDPFEERLLTDARRRGICRQVLPATGRTVLLALAATAAIAGLRTLARRSALPGTTGFDGQVIARWHEEADGENGSGLVSYISVDDGQRGWTFSGTEVFDRVALGDLVRVTMKPALAQAPRPDGDGPGAGLALRGGSGPASRQT